MSSIPSNIDELKTRMGSMGVSAEDLDKFQEEIDEGSYDIESIKEDISDREQSMLVDFFRENLTLGEKIYDIIKAIMDGTKYENKTDNIEQKTDQNDLKQDIIDNNQSQKPNTQPNISEQKHNVDVNDNKQSVSDMEEEKKEWVFNKNEEKGGDGTVILNAGLIIIPDEVITKSKYLENIDGITYVLYYNNCGIVTGECRLPYPYIEFWNDYLSEESPEFKTISDDIEHNEGPTYDYLMEHPPNDRILPVLEKVVDQLKYPQLDSNKEKRRKPIYKNDIDLFFKEQTPAYKMNDKQKFDQLIKTCILFKTNTNDTNFNTFELFINMMDIYDRIIFKNENKIKPYEITGKEYKNIADKSTHFAAKLDKDDYHSLNETLVHFKDVKKDSFFPKLEMPFGHKELLIDDDLQAFQMISLSFMLFVKSFMCETGNCLEKGNHIYKAKKKKKSSEKSRKPVKIVFKPNIKSLLDIKIEKSKHSKNQNKNVNGKIIIDDNDIFFHNDNMPLQFDLCIIPKGRVSKYGNDFGLEDEHKEFEIKSAKFTTPTNTQTVYQLYGDLVHTFRNVINCKKNKTESQADANNRASKPAKRRDDRYCIIFDRNNSKFYIYPPHVTNGTGKITHRKSVITSRQQQDKDKAKDDKNKANKANDKANNNDIDSIDKVANKFSLISHEYNDLTNFYLTNKCIIPSKKSANMYYGIHNEKSLQFVLSVHFHKQRQWHRHPKLRIYQYFNGGALRFFYSHKNIKHYKLDKDIIELWPQFFVGNKKKGIDEKFIDQCQIFDAVLDLYKCDAQYFQWDNAVKRQNKFIN